MIFPGISVAIPQPSRPTKESPSPLKSTNPSKWTIQEVTQFITYAYPTLGVHTSLFEDHVSDESI